jgi:ATP phosphoribosyltransferase
MNLALPKGHLQVGVLHCLAAAGYAFTFVSDRDYRPRCSDPALTARMFKVRAIPQLVHLGLCEVGFCGRDLIEETGYELVESVADLRLNTVSLVVAAARGNENILSHPPKRPLLVATEYPRLADRWAFEKNLAHITLQTYGSTEVYAPELADIIFDTCETGRTIEANGLVIIEHLFTSTTHLIANSFALRDPQRAAEIEQLRTRLLGAVRDG